jgi:uncharacterized protein
MPPSASARLIATPCPTCAHERVVIAGQELVLLADRAAYCPHNRSLFVADVHLGKASSFRSLGVPVPGGTTDTGLARLTRLIERWQPQTVYVLGDLLHGPAVQHSAVIDKLAAWRKRMPQIELVLVRGNHDLRAGDPPPRCGIRVADDGLRVAPWVLCHEPRDDAAGYVLAGHVHPAYRLRGRSDSVRLPAFWLRPQHAILPAFGEFTGAMSLRPKFGDRIVVSDGERVYRIPDAARVVG